MYTFHKFIQIMIIVKRRSNWNTVKHHSDAVASEPDVLQKLNAIRTSRSRKSVKPSQRNDNNDETIESEI